MSQVLVLLFWPPSGHPSRTSRTPRTPRTGSQHLLAPRKPLEHIYLQRNDDCATWNRKLHATAGAPADATAVGVDAAGAALRRCGWRGDGDDSHCGGNAAAATVRRRRAARRRRRRGSRRRTPHTHTHTRARTTQTPRTHARRRTHTHTRTHAQACKCTTARTRTGLCGSVVLDTSLERRRRAIDATVQNRAAREHVSTYLLKELDAPV